MKIQLVDGEYILICWLEILEHAGYNTETTKLGQTHIQTCKHINSSTHIIELIYSTTYVIPHLLHHTSDIT